MLSLVSLCLAIFLGDRPLKMEIFEHTPIQSRIPKRCLTVLLSGYQNLEIFGIIGSEL
jgi:hypothetical protein